MSDSNSGNNNPFWWNRPITTSDKITVINCYANTILFDMLRTENIAELLIEHPYNTTFNWITSGGFWSLIGLHLSNWNSSDKDKSVSWFATNGVLAFANILMLRKLLMVYKQIM